MTNCSEVSSRRCRTFSTILLCLLVVVGLAFFSSDLTAWLSRCTSWMMSHKTAGPIVFVALFVVLFVALVPSTPVELLAGYMFGCWIGWAALVVAQPLAHSAAFLLARRAGLLSVGDALRGRVKVFEAVELAIKEDAAAAWKTVFLVCLAFLPGGPKVYALAAISSVPFHVLPPCALLACAPQSLVNAWLGSNMKDFKSIMEGQGAGSIQEQRSALGAGRGRHPFRASPRHVVRECVGDACLHGAPDFVREARDEQAVATSRWHLAIHPGLLRAHPCLKHFSRRLASTCYFSRHLDLVVVEADVLPFS
mmetsp:Transcript_27734/g.74091  ORF Transcript_27734/g.74091 Transcript_27734/m.74091 type:complete len:308 (+) Transcript_27734:62-985(+)